MVGLYSEILHWLEQARDCLVVNLPVDDKLQVNLTEVSHRCMQGDKEKNVIASDQSVKTNESQPVHAVAECSNLAATDRTGQC